MTTTPTIVHIEARANYELERTVDPSLPAWEAAPFLTRARFLWAVVGAERENAA